MWIAQRRGVRSRRAMAGTLSPHRTAANTMGTTEPGIDALPPTDSLPERFGTNMVANYAAAAVVALSSFLITPILLHHLGALQFGMWSLAASVVGYLELLELGFGTSTTKLVAEDAWARPESVVRTLNTAIYVLLGLALAALAVGLVVTALAPTLFSVPSGLRTETIVTFAVLTVALSISIPGDAFGGALAGYQRWDLLSASNIALVVLTTVASAIVVLTGGGIALLAVVTAVISVSMHYVRWKMLHRLVPELRLSRQLVDRARLRAIAGLSWWFLVRDISFTIVLRIDIVVVGAVLGVKAVAIYAIGAKLAKLVEQALAPLSQLFFPHAAALDREGEHDQLTALLTDGTRATLLVGLPAVLILTWLAHPAVRAWVGHGYDGAAAVLVALSIAMGLEALGATAWEVLGGTRHARASAMIGAVEAVVNLGCSIALAYRYGITGVAIGTLVGKAVVKVPGALVIASHMLGCRLRTLARTAVLPHAAPVVLTTVLLAAGRAWSSSTPGVAATAVVAAAAYLAAYLAVGATPAERRRARQLATRLTHRTA